MVTEEGHSHAQVARDLDVSPSLLRRWRRKLEEDGEDAFPRGRLKPDDQRLRDLERENRRLRMEREILKKALTIFSGHPQ